MGYTRFSGEKFFARPGSREKKPERAPAVDAIRKGGVVHGATLLQFLIFCNQLPELRAIAVVWVGRPLWPL
jgi:hypothetical protein